MTSEPEELAVAPPGGPQLGDGTAAAPDEAERPTVGETVSRLIEDSRAYLSAEAEKQKLRAGIVALGARNAALFAIVALMLLFATLVTIMVGLTFALSRHIEPVWATLIVGGGGIALAVLLLLGAKGCVTRMMKAIKP